MLFIWRHRNKHQRPPHTPDYFVNAFESEFECIWVDYISFSLKKLPSIRVIAWPTMNNQHVPASKLRLLKKQTRGGGRRNIEINWIRFGGVFFFFFSRSAKFTYCLSIRIRDLRVPTTPTKTPNIIFVGIPNKRNILHNIFSLYIVPWNVQRKNV